MRAKKKALPTSRFDEIVAEIVHLLVSKGNTDKFAADKFAADKFAGTELVVRSTIQFLKGLDQGKPLWGFKKSNNDALSAVAKNVRDLRETLNGLPGELLMLLAVERLSEQVPSSLGQQNARVRLVKIIAMMNYLQTRCDDLLNQQPGERRSADFLQRLVADEAWRLMKYHTNLKPASGVASSGYGEIAHLLFEAVTGQEKDLERACKSALKRAKKGELNEWQGDTLFKGRLPA